MAAHELTRRALLQAAAAGPLAAAFAACTRRRAIAGRIVDVSDARGHLVRDGAPDWPLAAREEVPIVIVGGGVAGLSAAWKLAKSGVTDFVLLELEDALGGTAQGGANQTTRFPWGAHYIPVPGREQATLCELLAEMGVVQGFDGSGRAIPAEGHLLRAPDERLFFAGEWSEGLFLADGASADDLRQFARFERMVAELAQRRGADGRRWFAIPVVYASRDEPALALDRITMAQWLAENGFTSRRVLWYVEYACRDDYGTLLGDTSAWAGLHYFCARSHGEREESSRFLTWPEGNAFVVRHLARSVEGRVRTGSVVHAIDAGDGGVTIRCLDLVARTRREIRADHAICALPRFVARRLVRELATEPDLFHYSPWVVANVALQSRPAERGFPLCWDNVLYESESLGYVDATHQLDRAGRDSVWTWYRPFCDRDVRTSRALVQTASWESWRDAVVRDLAPAHADIADHVVSIDVRRFGHAMIRPEPGFLFGPVRLAAARPIGRIHFAGADLGGLPIFEEAQWSGVRAAEELLQARGVPFTSSL
jgi:protoporphyrinogen oxidase